MHTEALQSVAAWVRTPPSQWTVRAGTLAALVMALAVGSSTIVFSEPAPTDVLMAGAVVALPLLGAMRLGPVTIFNIALWLAIVALGLLALGQPDVPPSALMHQVVTLFLAAGSVAVAGYVAKDPEPRFQLLMTFYVAACLAATAAALIGYFRVVPAAYDLFTNYGRARGTFKDPNVFGAALVPALAYLSWQVLRGTPRRALAASAAMLVLALGVLLSFSRGAWLAAACAVAIVAWVSLVTARRRSDRRRLATATGLALAGLGVLAAAAVQVDEVRGLLEQRASMDQSYDVGREGRFGGQQKAITLALDNPFGIGTHAFRTAHHPEEPHNVYLSMFLNAGWGGGLLYLVTVALTLVAGLRLALRPGALQGPVVIAGAAFAAMALEGLVIDTDHWRHYFLLLGLIWGLADAEEPRPHTARRREDRAG